MLVVHRSAMLAEGLAAGLARFPELYSLGTATTVADIERRANGADVVVLDQYVMGAELAAARLRRRGIRVVVVGDSSDEPEEGDVRVSPRDSLASLAAAAAPALRMRPLRRGPAALTPREREILTFIGRGLPGKQVARHLGISPKTVEHHKTRIFSKLGVANQAAAVRLAMEEEFGGGERWARSTI